jgi:hypothetical protein
MKQKAIEEALIRLERVRQAIAIFAQPESTVADFRTAWWGFLLAANGIYSKLEQGSKGHGQSESWFGRKKHERRKDELLSYIYHARNSDEHSIEGSDAKHDTRVISGNKWTKIRSADGENTHVTVEAGRPLAVRLQGQGIHLRTVRDQYGNVFQPPREHMCKPLPESSIKGVVMAAEAYLNAMIEEASTLSQHI